jgi:hypothetical protein
MRDLPITVKLVIGHPQGAGRQCTRHAAEEAEIAPVINVKVSTETGEIS